MLNREQEELKAEVIRAERGPFAHWWEALLHADYPLLRRVHEYLVAAEDGPISEKVRHLLWTSVDSVVTHLYSRGAGVHAKVALEKGATVREVIECIEIASMVSSQAFGSSLKTVLYASGGLQHSNSNREEIASLKSDLGYWEAWMDLAFVVAPEYLKAFIRMQAPQNYTDGLDKKTRELILMATYSCPAIVNLNGVKRHADRAVAAGSTQQELVQALMLANGIGLHSISEAIMVSKDHIEATHLSSRSR